MRPLIGLVLLAGLAGCAGKSPPVPVQASAADIGRLAGRWEGEYNSNETGRGGSIVFTLTAGRDTAEGDVLMIPTGSNRPIMREGLGRPPYAAPGTAPSVLSIRFVEFRDGQVSGELDPYRAPDCNCIVATTFIGTVSGDAIKGTFTIRGGPCRSPASGKSAGSSEAPGYGLKSSAPGAGVHGCRGSKCRQRSAEIFRMSV